VPKPFFSGGLNVQGNRTINTIHDYLAAVRRSRFGTGRTVARIICRILLTLALLAVSGFVLLVLIGLWDRYEQKTAASDFSGIHVEDLASQADFSRDPKGGVGREQLAPARFFQQVPKLVGTGAEGSTNQGMSVALSADGNTAIVGGPGPNNADRDRSPLLGSAGAAWVFTRSGGVWTQQGNKLVGTTSQYGGGLWSQGASVALSADGNTAIVGGPSDNRTTGAAWVFTRSSAVWTQQGDKLVGTGAYEAGEPPLPLGQGLSVALSADGSTAIVGGWRAEAAWVFTRSGAVWTQQGKKLVGTGAVGSARQGMSVALSGDGNTAIVGGPGDNPWDRLVPFGVGATGAAWVFTRSGAVWTQQGDKLVGTGARQGMSVALSADGNIALVGGFADDGGVGAASVFTRSDGHWTQDKKLAGIGAVGQSAPSVALSADGSIVMVGGPNDNGGIGAAWVLTRTYDYREPLAPSTRPPNPPSLTASTPPLPPPNLEE
jgi:lipocalin